MESKARIPAILNEMGATEITVHIGEDRHAAIRASDPHPFFIRLRVGYEGISKGSIQVDGREQFRSKYWHEFAVNELAGKLNSGAPGLFVGTHADRGQSNRPRVGEVLSGYADDAPTGKRTAYAFGYVRDPGTRRRVQAGELDCCSIEADIVIGGLDSAQPYVEQVTGVSGVVLADSSVETPGFEKAGVDAVVAEMEKDQFLRANPVSPAPGDLRETDPFLRSNPVSPAPGDDEDEFLRLNPAGGG